MLGPIIVFPKTVFSWNVESVAAVTSESLSIFTMIEPKIQTLIIGTGEKHTSLISGKTILEISTKHQLNVEVLPTELVCFDLYYTFSLY